MQKRRQRQNTLSAREGALEGFLGTGAAFLIGYRGSPTRRVRSLGHRVSPSGPCRYGERGAGAGTGERVWTGERAAVFGLLAFRVS